MEESEVYDGSGHVNSTLM